MSYNTLLLLHIISVILLLGIGGGSAFYKFMADRSKNVAVIVHTNKMVVLADWLFTTPAVIAQPLTGLMLMEVGFSWDDGWLVLSMVLYALSIALWLVALFLQIEMKQLASMAQEQKIALDKRYYRLVHWWITLGIFSSLAMGGIMILMIFKFNF